MDGATELPLARLTCGEQAFDRYSYPCSILLLPGTTHSPRLACDGRNGSLDKLTGLSESTPAIDLTTPTQEASVTDEAYRNSHLIQVP